MSAGDTPAVLFYLLDRHALLAMTMESKCIFLNSLTTPPCGHPSNGGELIPRRDESQVPLCGGVARSAGVVIVPHPPVVLCTTPPRPEPPTQTMFARGPVGGGHYLHSILCTLIKNGAIPRVFIIWPMMHSDQLVQPFHQELEQPNHREPG